MIESHRERAKNEPGRERDQGGKGSQWKRACIICELAPRQAGWIEWIFAMEGSGASRRNKCAVTRSSEQWA
eukprot:5716520-Pyramimonas_sp.AAC.1